MTTAAVIIPFRDRGVDPRRAANLKAVLSWWESSPWDIIVADDGRTGNEQFNRSAAYNRGASSTAADVLVYTESDMLLEYEQIARAIKLAMSATGLVVPFTQYRYMGDEDSVMIREDLEPAKYEPQTVYDDGFTIGPVNVVSRATLDAVGGGYTERTEGNWYDDNIMHRAFDVCAGPTRWVSGPAYHLFHLPGFAGDHLTDADKAATANNLKLWNSVQAAGQDADAIRKLL